MTGLTLYGDIGTTRTWWVAWTCAELGLEVDVRSQGPFVDAGVGDEYRRLNPNLHVPTLVDGGFALWESMAINLYLARRSSGALAAGELQGEALAWQWSFWAVTRLEAPLLTLMIAGRGIAVESPAGRYFARHVARWDADEVARCREVLAEPLRVLDEAVRDRPHLLGDRFTVADLNVACILSRWTRAAGVDLSGHASLSAWLRRCWSRPACPRREALVALLDA